ncbi:MAG: hypothetical protein KAJ37_05385, partial [Candidatus Krumholzibacteria bacterium]|nr:hypothetical protein [Candidatus Krumholzibacteria bacterium]
MERSFHSHVHLPLVLSFLMVIVVDPAIGQRIQAIELDELVIPAEKKFLLTELARVQPPERLRELSNYGQHQLELGGGFYGMLPEQLADRDSIPVPTDESGRLKAALCLARQRRINLDALRQVNPDYALAFRGESLPDFVDRVALEGSQANRPPDGLSLELD